jgi:hypothetical protein
MPNLYWTMGLYVSGAVSDSLVAVKNKTSHLEVAIL